MSEISGALTANITESALIRKGAGKVYGVVVNSHTSGTLKLVDGLYGGAAASGTLTSSGACVPASHTTSVLTSDATQPADGDTVTLNTTVYRFKTTIAQAYDVAIGASVTATLLSLKKAINGNGTIGTDYYVGTEAHPTVYASASDATTVTVWARVPGTTANAYPTTETSSHLSWADTTLGGGTGSSNPGVTTAGATVTIGDNTYMAVVELSETSGATSVANEVLWVTSEAVFLDNLKKAINCTGLPGTDYSTTTLPNAQVRATTNTDTAQTVEAISLGTAGNAIATTDTLANYAWGAGVLASGTGTTGRVLNNTFTFASGSSSVIFPEPETFSTGLLAVVGGTAADLTIIYNEA